MQDASSKPGRTLKPRHPVSRKRTTRSDCIVHSRTATGYFSTPGTHAQYLRADLCCAVKRFTCHVLACVQSPLECLPFHFHRKRGGLRFLGIEKLVLDKTLFFERREIFKFGVPCLVQWLLFPPLAHRLITTPTPPPLHPPSHHDTSSNLSYLVGPILSLV